MEGEGQNNSDHPGHRDIRCWIDRILLLLPIAGFGVIVYLLGWRHGAVVEEILLQMARWIAFSYAGLFLVRYLFLERMPEDERIQRWIFTGVAVLILLSSALEGLLIGWIHEELKGIPIRLILLVLAVIQQVSVAAMHFTTWIPRIENSFLRRLNPGTILFATFGLLILAGMLLLKVPNATTEGITWLDALFTSTSAVCVTGLIVVDTATAFTPFGQAVILILIQSGAFGIVTLTYFLAVVTGQGFSVAGSVFLKDVLNLDNLRSLGSAILFLVGFTVVAEVLGCLLLFHYWQEAGAVMDNPWWAALFHSVSAFCNAGFSIFTEGLADDRSVGNIPLQAVIMALIVLGGIGFPVLRELSNRLGQIRFKTGSRWRFSIHLRLAIGTTVVLLAAGSILLYFGDSSDVDGQVPRIWAAMFNAVTARTAGFNITDMGALPSAATAILIFLMFVGGSPGGYAGGIKTTTFALAILNLKRILLARRDLDILGRRVGEGLCNRAFAVVMLSFLWIFGATTVILFIQPEFHLLDTLFETVSAFATVGLSRGITGDLSGLSKWVIIATMFVGRIGVMNFFFSLLVVPPRDRRLRMPSERLIIE